MMIEASREHLRFIAPDRRVDIEELMLQSPEAKSCFVDGEFIGMGGVVCQAASLDGVIWLYIDEKQRARTQTVVRNAVRELRRIAPMYRKLASAVEAKSERDLSFAQFMGFEIGQKRVVEGREFRDVIYEGAL